MLLTRQLGLLYGVVLLLHSQVYHSIHLYQFQLLFHVFVVVDSL